MRVLLHACCGPCLLEPFDSLSAEHEVMVCFANPNIQPADEYGRRRDTLARYAEVAGIDVIETSYEPETWREATLGVTDDPKRRCEACYRLRIGVVAGVAATRGFDAVATTLSVSPYQDLARIREVGKQVCAEAGVEFVATDFTDRYQEAVRRSRELRMYRQNYCGCLPSRDEAEAARVQRRAARRGGRSER